MLVNGLGVLLLAGIEYWIYWYSLVEKLNELSIFTFAVTLIFVTPIQLVGCHFIYKANLAPLPPGEDARKTSDTDDSDEQTNQEKTRSFNPGFWRTYFIFLIVGGIVFAPKIIHDFFPKLSF